MLNQLIRPTYEGTLAPEREVKDTTFHLRKGARLCFLGEGMKEGLELPGEGKVKEADT